MLMYACLELGASGIGPVVFVWLVIPNFLWLPSLVVIPKSFRRAMFKSQVYNLISHKTDVRDNVHVCITSDQNTIGGMVTLINSIDLNTRSPVIFHLIVNNHSVEHLRAWIEKTRLRDIIYEVKVFPEEWVQGKVKPPGGRPELARPGRFCPFVNLVLYMGGNTLRLIKAFIKMVGISSMKLNYARYYLPKLYPDLKKIVYIDDDSIVQGDVSELYETKLDPGHWAAFSEDCTGLVKRLPLTENMYFTFIDFNNSHVQRLNMSPNACAFNVGVFVTDLELWRKHNVTAQLENWLVLNKKEEVYGNENGGGGSGPPMMLVFSNKYTNLNPSWHIRYLGSRTKTNYTEESIQQAKLLHWHGPLKPWKYFIQYVDIWDNYFLPDPTGQFKVRRKKP